ncbi:MAG: hypothetical protein AAF787_12765 [Chloroflexota bacterium]
MSQLPVNLIRDIADVEYNRGHVEGFEAGVRMSITLMNLYALLSSMLEIAAYESNRDVLIDKLKHMAMDRAGQPTLTALAGEITGRMDTLNETYKQVLGQPMSKLAPDVMSVGFQLRGALLDIENGLSDVDVLRSKELQQFRISQNHDVHNLAQQYRAGRPADNANTLIHQKVDALRKVKSTWAGAGNLYLEQLEAMNPAHGTLEYEALLRLRENSDKTSENSRGEFADYLRGLNRQQKKKKYSR